MDIALVGIGKIARDQHIPSIDASPDWNLKATISRQGRVDGVEAFDDFSTFLDRRPDIRVASLCMPPVPRFDYAAKAILAGRHVMLEKPPGASLSECYKLLALAQKQGVTLFATWHSREAAMVDAARDWLNDQRLVRMRVTWKEDVRRWHPGQEWIWQPGGLGVFDPGINAMSIVTKIVPDPLHITKANLVFPSNCQAPIAAQLKFTHPDGADVSADFDWRQEGDQIWEIEAETENGTMVLDAGGAQLTINGKQFQADTPALAGEYPRLYAHLAQLVATGKCDADFEPMRHVADAFLIGRRETTEPFHE